MTNEIYYQAKNPISHIAFANWLKHNFLPTISRENNLWIERTFGVEERKWENRPYDTLELFQIWCKLPVDKSLAIDEIKLKDNE